jgi:GDPmannose 4,6-dehydratase
MFGNSPAPQNEETTFAPQSPYGVAKLAAHMLVRNYREGYGLNAACGIMFNTESPRRGDNFVTKKITNWFSDFGEYCVNDGENMYYRLSLKPFTMLELGNIYTQRDWSYVTDSVDAIIKIAEQQKKTGSNTMIDYCFGSGKTHTVRDFICECIRYWAGSAAEKAMKTVRIEEMDMQRSIVSVCGLDIIRTVPKYFRPTEVNCLCCDHTKITRDLGWSPKVGLRELVNKMMPQEVKT